MRLFVSIISMLAAVSAAAEPIDYNRQIRPILADKCYVCHGPDANTRKADLRLDVEAAAKAVISLGKPDESELVHRIFDSNPDDAMPPADQVKQLSEDEKELLKTWIAEGAKFAEHWSFEPVKKPQAPSGKEVDHFVRQLLAANKMEMSEAADRITLVRRLSYDLRGLPPSVEEVDAYVADDQPGAYERLVDRMLESPHYGEKMAMAWLDLARYGDTNGYHADSDRAMWLYRDYVIEAFNSDKPFDQFIVENMAGDLLPAANEKTKIASGFNRCVTFNEEGGADPDEFYVTYAVDRANTTGQVFLGLTVSCAQCHDHKYDPISQKEFYQLYAFFNSVDGEIGAGGQSGYHRKPLPPLLKVLTDDHQQKLEDLDTKIPAKQKQLSDLTAKVRKDLSLVETRQKWEATFDGAAVATKMEVTDGLVLWLDAADVKPDQWTDKSGSNNHAASSGAPVLRQNAIGGRPAVRFDGKTQFFRTEAGGEKLKGDFTIITVVRHQAPSHHQMLVMWGEEAKGKRRALWRTNKQKLAFNGYSADVVGTADLPPDSNHILMLSKTGEDNQIRFWLDGLHAGDGKTKLEPFESKAITIGANNAGKENTAADFAEVLVYDRALGDNDRRKLGNYLGQKYGIAFATPAEILEIVKIPEADRTPAQTQQLLDYFARNVHEPTRTQFTKFDAELATLKKARADLEAQIPTTMVMVEMEKRKPAYVLMRGDFQQPGEEVQPDVPAIFPRLPADQPRNRLGLAHWLVDPNHPLVARVTVNRLWAQFFGVGLVKTKGDFGTQGEWPSHPQLLDWLAAEFVENGWDVKALQKKILLSEAYRQSSRIGSQHRSYAEIDPENRLFSRAPRFRHTAEEIRDTALAASGLLNRKIGGPSVKPYQPDNYLKAINKSWDVAAGDDLYRRGLYTFWSRTMLYPAFQIFDAPSRELCAVDRPRTNTPLQALVTLNDPTYVEAARVFGQRIAEADGDVDRKINRAFRDVLSRAPTEDEVAILKATHAEQLERFRSGAEETQQLLTAGKFASPTDAVDKPDAAAWTAVAQILLNLDEALTRE